MPIEVKIFDRPRWAIYARMAGNALYKHHRVLVQHEPALGLSLFHNMVVRCVPEICQFQTKGLNND